MQAVLLLTTFLATLLSYVTAETIVVTVGGGGSSDPSAVFQPQAVRAVAGDVILFNFTHGNHSATQSTFGSPCTPAHLTNSTINGFDSGFRDTVNGTAITTLSVPITEPIAPIWFFDYSTCAEGGVGAANINETSGETLDGFVRNAIRLNGTEPTAESTSTSSSPETAGGDSTATSGDSEPTTNSAQSPIVGSPAWNTPIVLTAVLIGLAILNL